MGVAFFHGDKGGVGKSTICATYGEYVLSRNPAGLAVIECDTRNADVGRYFKDHANVKVHYIDLRADNGWVECYNVLDEETASDIILSLPAGIGSVLAANSQDLIAALNGTNRHAALFWALGRTVDSVALLKNVMPVFGSSLPIVVVKNLYSTGGDPSKFSRWDASKTKTELMASGGVEIDFPELMDGIFDSTFGANPPVRFTEGHPRYGERLKLEQWVKTAFAAFGTIADTVQTGRR